MLILVSLFIVEFIFMFIKSKNLYTNALSEIDKNEYPLKKLLPVGLYFMELINYSYKNSYDRNLYKKYYRLKGKEKANFFKIIHWGQKVLYIHIAFLIILFLGLSMKKDLNYLCISIVFLLISIIGKDLELNKEIKKKYVHMKIDFAEFINKLSLLVGAGLTITAAWRKIIENNNSDSEFYNEIKKVQLEVDNGKSFNNSLENLAMRCQSREISRFVSVLVQNYLKGNENIVMILDQLSNDVLESRKREAKLAGEKINSKLIFPMIINLIAIFIMLSIPAILMISSLI